MSGSAGEASQKRARAPEKGTDPLYFSQRSRFCQILGSDELLNAVPREIGLVELTIEAQEVVLLDKPAQGTRK